MSPDFTVDDAMVNDFKAFIDVAGRQDGRAGLRGRPGVHQGDDSPRHRLALFGVASARKHLIEADPQAQFAVSLFREAEQLTQLARAKAARNEQRYNPVAIGRPAQAHLLRIGLSVLACHYW